jgi:hypothetical protein
MALITYRITKHTDNRFSVDVRNDDHGGWRTTGEFATWRQADAEKARLQKLVDVAESKHDAG